MRGAGSQAAADLLQCHKLLAAFLPLLLQPCQTQPVCTILLPTSEALNPICILSRSWPCAPLLGEGGSVLLRPFWERVQPGQAGGLRVRSWVVGSSWVGWSPTVCVPVLQDGPTRQAVPPAQTLPDP